MNKRITTNRNDDIIGFGELVPSIAKAPKMFDGKMLPFGVFRLLKALNGKNTILLKCSLLQ